MSLRSPRNCILVEDHKARSARVKFITLCHFPSVPTFSNRGFGFKLQVYVLLPIILVPIMPLNILCTRRGQERFPLACARIDMIWRFHGNSCSLQYDEELKSRKYLLLKIKNSQRLFLHYVPMSGSSSWKALSLLDGIQVEVIHDPNRAKHRQLLVHACSSRLTTRQQFFSKDVL